MNEREIGRDKQGERDKGRTREKREYHSRAERLKEGYTVLEIAWLTIFIAF